MTKKKRKTALITGLSGQDGSYLAKFLLNKNYKVIGTNRRSARFTWFFSYRTYSWYFLLLVSLEDNSRI